MFNAYKYGKAIFNYQLILFYNENKFMRLAQDQLSFELR